MTFDILTIFPNFFDSFLTESLVQKALKKGVFSINVHNLRDWTNDKHKTTDDRPFGGGAGMVMLAEPIINAIASLGMAPLPKKKKVVLFSPTGKRFNQKIAEEWTKFDQIIMVCGRYEGIDARVENFIDEKISIGDFVLSGGEIPAMTVIETVGRLLPGYLGNAESKNQESFSDELKNGLEYPQYTRPEKLIVDDHEYGVPEVLLSGNHKEIEKWRKEHINYSNF